MSQRAGNDPDHPIRSLRLRLALDGQRIERLGDDGVANELERALADDDLARARGLLEPRGDIAGIAGGERAGDARSGEDLAGVDAGVRPQADAEGPFQLFVQRLEGGTHVDGGAHRTQRIVLVHDGHAEHRRDRVADELLDRAAVAFEHGEHRLEVAREHAVQDLRVELLAESGRLDEVGEEHRDRLPAAGRCGPRRGRRLGRSEPQRRVLPQDRALELLELHARLESQPLDEHAARFLVGGEGVGLAPRPVEREHELSAKALPQRIAGDERLQLGDELGMSPELEVGVDALLDGGEPCLLEADDLGLREWLVGEIRERAAPPEGKRLVEQLGAPAPGGLARACNQSLESFEVERARFRSQQVARRMGLDDVAPEGPAELRHRVVHRLRGGLRRPFAVELVDQPLGREELVRTQQKEGEDGAAISTADLDPAVAVADLERPQKSKFEHSPCPWATTLVAKVARAPLSRQRRGYRPVSAPLAAEATLREQLIAKRTQRAHDRLAERPRRRARDLRPGRRLTRERTTMTMTAKHRLWVRVLLLPLGVLSATASASGAPLAERSIHASYDSAYSSLPSWSPDGAEIAFQSDRDGDSEIFTMIADGKKQIQLTRNTASESYPDWSPDGTRIAFSTNREGDWEIYVMNADGTGQAPLTSVARDDWNPSWSPDGKKIAFVSEREGNSRIYVMNADGSDQQKLTADLDVDDVDTSPSWSPDGTRIAFVGGPEDEAYIDVVSTDGSGRVRLTDSEMDYGPSWSPDGTQLLFASDRDGDADLYAMEAHGANPRRLPVSGRGDEWWPQLSPDGDTLAFVSDRDGTTQVHVAPADGSDARRLTGLPRVLASTGERCTILGTSGDDTLRGTSRTDVICGLGGSDTLRAFDELDTLDGGAGNDVLVASSGDTTLAGGDGNDLLRGAGGDDSLDGGRGADRLVGNGGKDDLAGGPGNDAISARDGLVDRVDGGPGEDRAWTDRDDWMRNVESVFRNSR